MVVARRQRSSFVTVLAGAFVEGFYLQRNATLCHARQGASAVHLWLDLTPWLVIVMRADHDHVSALVHAGVEG